MKKQILVLVTIIGFVLIYYVISEMTFFRQVCILFVFTLIISLLFIVLLNTKNGNEGKNGL